MIIQAFFRAEPADTRVRLWIEGEAGGRAVPPPHRVRRPGGLGGKAVRATDLPAGGLDSARLRFEMMTPGTLWIDDLRVVGEAPPKAVRLNAQRTLLAALQAYRDAALRRVRPPVQLALGAPSQHPGGQPDGPPDASSPDAPAPGGPARPRLLPYRLIAGCGKIARRRGEGSSPRAEVGPAVP